MWHKIAPQPHRTSPLCSKTHIFSCWTHCGASSHAVRWCTQISTFTWHNLTAEWKMQSTFHTEPMARQCLEQPLEPGVARTVSAKAGVVWLYFFSTVNSRMLLTYNFSAGSLSETQLGRTECYSSEIRTPLDKTHPSPFFPDPQRSIILHHHHVRQGERKEPVSIRVSKTPKIQLLQGWFWGSEVVVLEAAAQTCWGTEKWGK